MTDILSLFGVRSDVLAETPEGTWEVQSEAGKVLGTFPTRAEAAERLRQIEAAVAAKKGDSIQRVRRVDYLGQSSLSNPIPPNLTKVTSQPG